ncbi:hypothetical protein EIJ81_00510 (plasmid) [Aliivibrio salmonicida]|uniref:conjugative transfer protein MobI(A/C) n=1 Tax=Aliivibrio salmonicida TaxID=40269 RepID=UPI000F6C2786|nr:conjugative transfer protein MobI(A/C) [Aliivibrio salmonicida]AZL83381.1 hypothetical protein EIJ81_00510 [Aliivibrio salmonicida]
MNLNDIEMFEYLLGSNTQAMKMVILRGENIIQRYWKAARSEVESRKERNARSSLPLGPNAFLKMTWLKYTPYISRKKTKDSGSVVSYFYWGHSPFTISAASGKTKVKYRRLKSNSKVSEGGYNSKVFLLEEENSWQLELILETECEFILIRELLSSLHKERRRLISSRNKFGKLSPSVLLDDCEFIPLQDTEYVLEKTRKDNELTDSEISNKLTEIYDLIRSEAGDPNTLSDELAQILFTTNDDQLHKHGIDPMVKKYYVGDKTRFTSLAT